MGTQFFSETHAGSKASTARGFRTTDGTEIVFLQDLSDSFANDLPSMRNSIDEVIERLKTDFSDARFSLSTLTDGGIYTAVATSSSSGDAVIDAYGRFTALGDEREAVLGALTKAAAGTDLDLAPGSRRIIVVATDETYRDGIEPDNTSIADARLALEQNDATPIFAVTSDVRYIYDELVQQLGRGAVVTITSNAENFADAMRAAAAIVNGLATALGDDGDNILLGGDVFDGMYGGLGNDLLDGRGGDDTVDGGAGNDIAYGGSGNDSVLGGTGSDVLIGDAISGISLRNPSAKTDLDYVRVFDTDAFAVDISPTFDLVSNSNVVDSQSIPHTSFSSIGNGGYEFYAITLTPGSRLIVDIDGGYVENSGTNFDSYLTIYDPRGVRVAYNDDSSTSDGAGGSSSSYDSYLEHTATIPGNYFIEVRSYNGEGVPAGATYTIRVSVDEPEVNGGSGPAGNDILDGGDGDDFLYGSAGNDQIFGGEGFDIAVFDGSFAGRTLFEQGGTTLLALGTEADLIEGVEKLIFDDVTLNLVTDSTGLAGQVYRLYQAAFDRTPDTLGLSFWHDQIEVGRHSLFTAASSFISSQEFQNTYGGPTTVSDVDFATLLYNNVLNRGPDGAGFDYWVNALGTGVSREQVLLSFSESAENKLLTSPAISDGFWLA